LVVNAVAVPAGAPAWLRHGPRVAAGVAGVIGLVALLGWALGAPAVGTLGTRLPTMTANSAIAFLVASAAMALSTVPATGPRRMARLGGALLVVFGLAVLIEWVAGTSLGIDQLLAHDPARTGVPGRPSPQSAVAFLILGGIALTSGAQREQARRAHSALIACFAFAVVAVGLGYLYGTSSLSRSANVTGVSPLTLLALLALLAGLLIGQTDRQPLALLWSTGQTRTLTRRLLPAVVFVPPLLGFVRLLGQDAGLYNTRFGLALFTGSLIAVFMSLVLVTIRAVGRGERAREQTLAELREAQRIAMLGLWWWDPQAGKVIWSEGMYWLFGRDPRDGPAQREELLAHVHPDDRERIPQPGGSAAAVEFEVRIIAGDGAERTVQVLGREDPERPGCYVGSLQDVTDLRAAERTARAAQERFRRAFDEAPIGMALISLDGAIEEANAALGTICGRTRKELEGLRLWELVHPADIEPGRGMLRALAAGDSEQLRLDARFVPVAGSPVEVSVHGVLLRDAGHPDRVLCQFHDVTDRKRFEEQLLFMADHDALTGLWNRRKFEEELERQVAHVRRYGLEGAVMVVDVDDFKSVNDTFGHSAGDELIVAIAVALRDRLRRSDVLARLAGDEFAVLLPKASEAEAAQVAEVILRAVRDSAVRPYGRAKVTASIGVAMLEHSVEEELSAEALLIEADLAMYDAKEAGRDRLAFYATSEHRTSRIKARLTWAARIEHALAHDRFTLFAQPILDLRTHHVHRYELLIRMLDERDDLIPPATFLYIASRFGLIARLDEWVVTHAIELAGHLSEIELEVNISGGSLGDQPLMEALDRGLRTARIDPARLILEVSETAAVANLNQAQAFAQRLRDLGCRFSLDDFGAGFGSFYYLKHLPFDCVKIDGEFVRHAGTGRVDQLVIDAIVRIAQGLGKETVAEFVTDEQTQRIVHRLGVDFAQGFHIGQPVLATELFGVELPQVEQ
jgi:diguanylate cyclase (GGDEF)-like protein/PAS domain S-box-containing protein